MNNRIVTSRYSPEEARKVLQGLRLLYCDVDRLGLSFLPREDAAYYTPEGKLLCLYLTDIFTEDEQAERRLAFSHVKGDLRNRPEIFGIGARQQLLRKDGSFSAQTGVPSTVLETAGTSATYGPYRYKNRAPGQPDCHLTGPTLERPDLYARILRIGMRVTEIYKLFLPEEYALQMKYIDTLLPDWKMPMSAFTSIYGLKDQPTAVHTDEFDIPTATGVLTTSGCFTGNEFCLPEYGLAIDVQPSDILFADVHSWHGNLPRRTGSRVAQVYFVRKGMHECPVTE